MRDHYNRRNQPEMDSGILDLIGLAQASNMMGMNEPPPLKDLISLLGIAGELNAREQEMGIERNKLALEQQKAQQVSPDMVNALLPFIHGNPQATENLVQRAAPGVLPPQASPQQTPSPDGASSGPSRLPKGRLSVKSQAAFHGYEPPQGDVEAVLDEQGNIINFVGRGGNDPVTGFVPDAQSVGGWAASKYAVAQQMEALGRMLGFNRPQGGQIAQY